MTVVVPPRDREVLASWVRSPLVRAGLAQRARIVLLAGDGARTNEIVRRTGASKPTVILWKKRYAAEGVGGLEDRPRPGKPRVIDDMAVVLCVDEKPQAQALERKAPALPLRPGVPEKRSHDYVRHGTTALFAAPEAPAGKVTGACYPQHRHQEFLAFLRQVARTYPRRRLHIVCDSYDTHTHPGVRAWLARHPRITLHFTPTSGSWLNLAEVFFSVITRQAIRRGSFTSVKDLWPT